MAHVSRVCQLCLVLFQSSSKASETGTNEDSNFKDDDEDDDNDDDEKVPPGSNIDPEKLKSFNVSDPLYQKQYLSRSETKPTKWPVRSANTQISLSICPVWSVFAGRSMGS